MPADASKPRDEPTVRAEIDRLRSVGQRAVEDAKHASWIAKQDMMWAKDRLAEADALEASLEEPQP